MNWMYKLERKYGKYAIAHLAKYLAILNGATFLVLFIMNSTAQYQMYNAMALIPARLLQGELWRLFTWIVLPATLNPLYAALSIYLFYIIGTAVERNWGAFRFNLYYLIGMVGTLIGAVLVGLLSPGFGATTATYLNLSLFLAFATMFPEHKLLLFFFLPVKVKWLGWLQAAFFIWTVLSNVFTGQWVNAIAPLVSILNYLLFFGKDLYSGLHLKRRVHSNRRRFFDEINRVEQERKGKEKEDDNVRRFK